MCLSDIKNKITDAEVEALTKNKGKKFKRASIVMLKTPSIPGKKVTPYLITDEDTRIPEFLASGLDLNEHI